jgi:hypothetical protein
MGVRHTHAWELERTKERGKKARDIRGEIFELSCAVCLTLYDQPIKSMKNYKRTEHIKSK